MRLTENPDHDKRHIRDCSGSLNLYSEEYMTMRAFIWDLDGTLIDSYGIIIESLQETFQRKANLNLSKEEIRQEVLNHSVIAFIAGMCDQYGLLFDEIRETFSEINDKKALQISLINNAMDILSYLNSAGDENYVYTHKGNHTNDILEHTGILMYFKEVVTSKNGFSRKPSPDGLNYLVEKHHLNTDSTFYVGDRQLDMECARNAHVKGILYLAKDSIVKQTGLEDFVVDDLIKIKEILPLSD